MGEGTDFNGAWTFETTAFRGERRDGQWSVRVVDDSVLDSLTVSALQLVVAGANTTDDRYIYTDEYSSYAGISGHLTAVNDANNGTDIVDASAVTSNSTIRLDGVAGKIDGVATTFANIEHAIGGDGNDTMIGDDGANRLVGNRGRDSLSGGAGNDSLYGGTGNDKLEGGAGDNLLTGGAGDDTYIVSGVADVLVEAAGEGTDSVHTALASYSIASIADVENIVALGSGNVALTGNVLNNVVTGNSGNNVLNGGSGDDTMTGGAGNDRVIGGAGNDAIDGGSGNDIMIGGAGNDSYVVNATGDKVFETTSTTGAIDAGGIDTVQSGVSFNLDSSAGVRFVERLTLTGTGAISGTGNALNNVLTGNGGSNGLNGGAGNDRVIGGAGNDAIDGGLGNDIMIGGAGNDSYVVNATGDKVFETTTTTGAVDAGGIDTVQSEVSFNLDSSAGVRFVERLTLTGTAAINGTGNALANILTGNTASNVLSGGLGNDTIDGGLGNDIMIGGAGNDRYVVNATGDKVFETTTTTGAVDAGGIDTVQSEVSFNLDSSAGVRFVERLMLTGTAAINGTGNALANILTGNTASNVLSGGLGNDSVNGGSGNDKLTGDGGNDTLEGGSGRDSLVGGVGDDRLLGGGSADKLTGGDGNDRLIANNGTDRLYGNKGNDRLQAGGSADRAFGGSGNDKIEGQKGGDRLNGNSGNDRLYGGAGADTLKGGSGVDKLFGDVGKDTLFGGSKADILLGGTGKDMLSGGTGADMFVFKSTADSGAGRKQADVISDFAAGDDLVKLSRIDADTTHKGNDAFTFIGTDGFSGTAGELRYTVASEGVRVFADTNGDGRADMQIRLTGIDSMAATDFIL